jgi:hypothetical protein
VLTILYYVQTYRDVLTNVELPATLLTSKRRETRARGKEVRKMRYTWEYYPHGLNLIDTTKSETDPRGNSSFMNFTHTPYALDLHARLLANPGQTDEIISYYMID